MTLSCATLATFVKQMAISISARLPLGNSMFPLHSTSGNPHCRHTVRSLVSATVTVRSAQLRYFCSRIKYRGLRHHQSSLALTTLIESIDTLTVVQNRPLRFVGISKSRRRHPSWIVLKLQWKLDWTPLKPKPDIFVRSQCFFSSKSNSRGSSKALSRLGISLICSSPSAHICTLPSSNATKHLVEIDHQTAQTCNASLRIRLPPASY